ncbi:MAG: site-specific integrase [Aliidongia sp.]
MASIRKRTLPSGKVVWQADYRDSGGSRRSKQFKTKGTADAFMVQARHEVASGTHVADSATITLDHAGELWIERAVREGLEASTIRQYRQHLKHHIVPELGTMKLTRLTRARVEAFRDGLVKKLSRPMARAVLASLKGVLKEAHRLGLASHNAAAETTVDVSRRDRRKVEIPTKAEIRAILALTAELWPHTRIRVPHKGERRTVAVSWRPFMVTAIFTGMRCSELRGLTWEHVDLDKKVIQIRQRADFQNVMGSPKTEAGNRDIPMAPMVANTLKAWRLVCPDTPLNLVFPTEAGTIHTNSNVHQHCWRPLQRKLGIVKTVGQDADGNPIERPRFTFHSLRHAAASMFIEQGWTPKKVQTVMGHASIQVTFDTYGHLWANAEDDAEAMAQMEARLLG